MKSLISNMIGSWITSGAGAILGLPEIWAGIAPLLDDDPATGADWGLAFKGLVIFVAFLAARDGNKSSEDVKVKLHDA